MNKNKAFAQDYLREAYRSLGFDAGELLDADDNAAAFSLESWVDKGEWLSLAKQVGAEKLFFVNNNPVAVFASCNGDDEAVLRLFNRVWCMARPSYLFIARDGELSVYGLDRPPVRRLEEWLQREPLELVTEVNDVATKLKSFARDQIESGKLFEEENRFGKPENRADQRLISDLRQVRAALIGSGLAGPHLKYAHALIGRVIFIRYLEDRDILPGYFEKVAAQANRSDWSQMLSSESSHYNANPETRSSLFPKILSSLDFTYAVFDALAEDFNGDMFPSDGRERRAVTETHLQLLQRFLLGDASEQQPLFFWAYRFDIIPVELISSIYEEFYHHETSSADKEDDKGTHYTPGSLVEFTLSQVLTPEKLSKRPRILDPACGSGIFLVEAFRRVVRYHVHDQGGERLNVAFLRSILKDQIAGIEINKEAIRVTAFSLYLALLHYQEPKDILLQISSGNHLPKLIYDDAHPPDADHFNNLLGEDAFRVTFEPEEAVKLPSMEEESTFPFFLRARVDIIVGNPPWGGSDVSDNAFAWCKSRSLPVGDRELSQAFVWKSLDLLAEGGSAGLLVSTGLFFKHATNSVEFRRHWLKVCRLKEVVNFAHVRKVFFPSGSAPFASVVFEKRTTSKRRNAENLVSYWSAKKTAQINKLRAVILSPVDLKRVRQEDLRSDDKLWKIYWWGNDRDRALISWLDQWTCLGEIADELGARLISGRGFEVTRIAKKPAEWLADYPEFPTNKFARYGPLDPSALRQVPHSVYRRGTEDIYSGERLLIKRGISQTPPPKGMIVARFASERFCFRNSIHGIKLRNGQTWEYKVLLAIFWSSLARYYYFLTSSAWGMWHDEVHLEEIGRLPVRFPETPELIDRIVSLVDRLSALESTRPDSRQKGLFATQRSVNTVSVGDLEMELDEAVFDLYELSGPERDQVRDMCQFGLDFFYNDSKSSALSAAELPGHWIKVTQPDLFSKPAATEVSPFVADYIRVFVEAWNRELEAACATLDWKVIGPENDTGLLAILFGAYSFNGKMKDVQPGRTWSQILRELDENLLFPHRSRQVFIDGIVRAITPDQMLIIKRNEMRFWTKSAAREDVQALMVQAMNRQLTFDVADGDVVVNG